MKSTLVEKVIILLSKKNTRLKFKEICGKVSCTPKMLDEAIYEIRKLRPDLMFGKIDRCYWFSNTPTWYSNQTDLSRTLPETGIIGILSDTHLGSIAERLDLLNAAYSEFKRKGITTVLHGGDLTDGWKEYRNHSNFVKVAGDQDQAKYAIEHYPKVDGITTYVIGGNHDDSYGHSKIDRLSLVTHGFHHQGKNVKGRNDIIYVGQYSHYFLFPQEVRLHLLHPRGQAAYARSYKQQKRSESMTKNERPDIQVSAHFHTFNYTVLQGTHMLALPGLQDETEFFKRLGLERSLGFCIVEYEIKKGKLRSFAPRVFMYD